MEITKRKGKNKEKLFSSPFGSNQNRSKSKQTNYFGFFNFFLQICDLNQLERDMSLVAGRGLHLIEKTKDLNNQV